jgi:quinol monooxygenase YgiN
MIVVIASVRVKPGKRAEFLKIFKTNVPAVRKEKGCIEYLPTVDAAADLPPQLRDENEVTVIEKWESVESLHEHLNSPHMLAYRNRIKGMAESVSLKVLEEA